jgi:WD40 repeat protein
MPFLRSCTLLVLAGWSGGPAAAFPLSKLDSHGDPLPSGAVARLGTVQLRGGCDAIHFSADGQTLTGVDRLRAYTWDSATGRLLISGPLPSDGSPLAELSEDGRTAVLAGRDKVWLCDLPSAKRMDVKPPQKFVRIGRVTVSNDRRYILVADYIGPDSKPAPGPFAMTEPAQRLLLWDTTAGTARTLVADEAEIAWLAFSPDGKRAVSSCRVGTRAWDTATGKKLWEVRWYTDEQCHFTPDGKFLVAAPGGGQRAWHVWDVATGKAAAGLRPPTISYAWSFAVSPDGARLLIPTDTDYVLWDLRAGEVRHRWPGATQGGRGTFAPDGRSVVTSDTILRRWDLATGKNLYADVAPLGHTAAVRRLFFTPDGRRLVSVGDDGTARIWDVAAARPLRTIPIDPAVEVWAMTPDGSTLVGVDERLTVHRWPLTADGPKSVADLRDAQKLNVGLRPREAHVLPDGTLALLAWPKSPEYQLHRFSFSFWDPATGRLVRWGGDPGNDYRGDYVRLSPDGRLVAGSEAAFDTRTGAKRGLPGSPFGLGGTPVFSPDGRLLATAARETRIWEVATGRVLIDLPGGSTDHAAFSPDGRRLAVALPDRLAVWDVGLRKPVAEWPSTDAALLAAAGIGPLTFGPDGRTLVTGHTDGTILVWKIPPPIPDGRWSEADAAAAWDALADANPGNAYPAVWQLSDYPAEVVPFLRGKFALGPVAGPDEWPKLIAALDSPRFAEREAASKRVRELGRAAEGPLRQALKHAPSPEQVARIEALLAALEPPARLTADDLRAIRAVAVLEACGSLPARRLLSEWAERGSPPRLADEASRAAERLKVRP